MKVALIVPYFGMLPNYYQLFLDSCEKNPTFDWIIFTDDQTEYMYPPNVHRFPMTFSQCQSLIKSCFDFEIALSKPQKLCDYKCAYGYIFREYLTGYDWWGHCDLDQIFGDLGAFITTEMLNTYDKIGSLGHLTLYRNTPENNRVFTETTRYRDVFSTERGCAFDEWLPGNINEIYLNSGRPVHLKNYGADINAYHMTFECVEYSIKERKYVHDGIHNSVFLWDDGKLLRIWDQDGQLFKQQYPYVHLQKRKMKDRRQEKNSHKFYIIPNEFRDYIPDASKMLSKSKLHGIINTQWIRVKWNSLRYRIKNGDWNYQNVFHSK